MANQIPLHRGFPNSTSMTSVAHFSRSSCYWRVEGLERKQQASHNQLHAYIHILCTEFRQRDKWWETRGCKSVNHESCSYISSLSLPLDNERSRRAPPSGRKSLCDARVRAQLCRWRARVYTTQCSLPLSLYWCLQLGDVLLCVMRRCSRLSAIHVCVCVCVMLTRETDDIIEKTAVWCCCLSSGQLFLCLVRGFLWERWGIIRIGCDCNWSEMRKLNNYTLHIVFRSCCWDT